MQFPGGQLSAGFIAGVCRNDPRWQNAPAFVQILEVKKLENKMVNAGNPQAEKHRVIVSDGVSYMNSILASQLSHLVADGTVSPNAVIKLTQYNVNDVNNRKLLLLLNLEAAHPSLPNKLGAPISIETGQPGPYGQPQQQQGGYQQAQQQPQAANPRGNWQQQQAAPRNNNFGQQQQQGGYQQQQQQGAGNNMSESIHPINALNPYQPRWTIRARCTFKPEIKTFNNDKGGGKLFSVDLLDESGEIRAVAFGEAVDNLYPLFQVDQVYTISKGTLRFANKRFNTLKNDYEIVLDNNSIVQRVDSANVRVPKMHYSFVNIDQITDVENNEVIDVVGIVQTAGNLQSIKSKAGKDLDKLNITLVDTTDRSVEVTLWGEIAQSFVLPAGEMHPVLVIKAVRVSDYNKRSLSTTYSSRLEFNPAIDKTRELREWWDSQDPNQITTRIHSITQTRDFAGGARSEGGAAGGAAKNAPEKTLQQVKDEQLGIGTPATFKTRATVMFIKQEPFCYTACPECKRKVTNEQGGWMCHKGCNRPFPNCDYRYVLSFTASDHSNSRWLSAFDETGRILFGMDAGELWNLHENNPAECQRMFQEAMFKTYNFVVRAKEENFESSTGNTLKCSVVAATPVDFVGDSRKMIEAIQAFGM